jgi:acyl-CoA synthetase (AMP-forming)/AMP-acid ligase II
MGDTFSPVTETATSQWLLPFFSIIRSSVRGSSLGLMEGETVLVAEKSSGSRRAALGSAQQQPESHAMERHFNVTDLQRYSPAVPRARVVRRRRSLGATGFSGVPATFARLVPLLEERPRELPALRYLTQAGAGMPPDLTRRVRSAFPTARLFVMYGQTEASARLAWLPPERLDEKLGSAGIAIPDVELSIIDEQGRELPRGEDGEVLARGPNIMRGYWRDPEESARARCSTEGYAQGISDTRTKTASFG